MTASAEELQRLTVSLEARFARFEREMAKGRRAADQGFRRIEERAKKSRTTIQRDIDQMVARLTPTLAGLFAGVSFAALQRGMLDLVRTFARFETQNLTTQQVLRATGFSAGRTAEQLEALARELGDGTLAATTAARDAANQLLTFRSITGETFDRAMRAAQDLAAVGFGTLESSTVQLGKALEDPVSGLTALRRVGVSFTQTQRELIASLVETGRVAEAQRVILAAVEAQVGGAGAAQGSGLAGAFDTLVEAVNIHIERTGGQVAELLRLQDAILGVANAIKAANAEAERRASPAGLAQDRIAAREQQADRLREIVARDDARIAALREFEPRARDMPVSELTNATDARAQLAALEAANFADNMIIKQERLRIATERSTATRRSEAAQAEMQADRVQSVVAALDEERAALSRSALENRIRQEIARAGVEAGSAEAQAIEARVRAIHAETEAQRRRTAAGGGAGRADAYAEEVARVEEAITALRLEAETVNLVGRERDRARIAQGLENAAREAGIAITPELVAMNQALAESYSEIAARIRETEERQEEVNGMWKEFGRLAKDAIEGVADGSQTLDQALANVLKRLQSLALEAALLGEGPLANLFGTKSSGGLFGLLGNAFKGAFSRAPASPVNPFNVAAFAGPYAKGGYVPPGKWGILGEEGPEPVFGGVTGVSVLPNRVLREVSRVQAAPPAALSAPTPGPVVHVTVNTPDAPSFLRSEAQVGRALARALSRGQRAM